MNTRSIQFRLISWYTVLAIIAALLFAVFTWNALRFYLYRNAEATLSRRAEQIAATILSNGDDDHAGQRIEQVYSPEANSRFIRIRQDGRVLYVSGSPGDRMFDPARVPYDVKNQEKIAGLFLITRPVILSGKTAAIDMGIPLSVLDNVLDHLLLILLAALPVGIGVMTAGGYILVGRALRPVSRISRQAETISFGNLASRLPVPATGDALETLSVTLNQMLERLDMAFQQASRFSADASHELRTPLDDYPR